jgi:sugar phosphate isomerase/epimerase
VLEPIGAAGFDAIDLWFGHLDWRWATPEHVAIARETLDRRGIRLVSLAGSIGATRAATWRLRAGSRTISTSILIAGPGDILRTKRGEVASVLRAHGVRFGLENHP